MKYLKKVPLWLITISFLLTFFVTFNNSVHADTVKDVEEHLMCLCEDKCGKMLKNCTCKYSEEMRFTIATKLKDGLTKDEILAFYIGQYGEKALAAPTKKGFNLLAWLTPFFVILLGGFAIRQVLFKWAKAQKKTEYQQVGTKDPVKNKYMNQMMKELKDFDA